MEELDLQDITYVGRNSTYTFGVGQVGQHWIGFAKAGEALFFFSQMGEQGYLGLKDRDKAILLTGAIAQAPENAYGGVTEWAVEERLRGDPEKFRCQSCEEVGCQGDCDGDANWDDDPDEEDALYAQEDEEDEDDEEWEDDEE